MRKLYNALLAVLLAAGVARANPVQGCQAADVSSTMYTSWGCSLPNRVTPGNSLIVFVRQGTNATGINGVTDSLGNAFRQLGTVAPNSAAEGAMFSSISLAAGGTDRVTVEFSVPVFHVAIAVAEYSGITSVDGVVTSTGSGTTCTSANLTTSAAADLLVFGCQTNGNETSFVSGTGYTVEQANARVVLEDRTGAAAGAYGATATYPGSTGNATILAAFKTNDPIVIPLGANTLTVIPPCPGVPCLLDISPLAICSATLTTSCATSFQLWHTDSTGAMVVDFAVAPAAGSAYHLTTIGKDANGEVVTPGPAAFNLELHP